MMVKPLEQYKAVFFDAGDTLLTIPETRVIFQQALAMRSFPSEEERVEGLLTEAFRLFYYGKQLDPEVVCSPESDREFWVKLYRFILDRLGPPEHWTEEDIHQVCNELYDIFVDPEHYRLFNDVAESLEKLKSMGLRMGIISNFAPTLRNILQVRGILDYFDPIIVSTEVGLEKPNPLIFRLALAESGLEAKDVLYIGDHEQNDIWASAQAGIDSVKINRYDYLKGDGILSLTELFQKGV